MNQPPPGAGPQATTSFGQRPGAASHAVDPSSPVATTHKFASDTATPHEGDATAPGQPTSTWIGKRIDKYIIEKQLGGGGMGEVFLGRHRWLDVSVAVKVLRPMLGHDAIAVERFHREAKLMANLDHPNIVRAVDGGPIDNSCYLVTEFLDGMDLAEIVDKRGPLHPTEACAIVYEMCKGLHYAHEHQLVHRDVKPQNAMVLKNGGVKILDLGLARMTMTDAATQMTATGQFMGTVDYVSPEQALDTHNLDHRADIYSLGCTLYFLLTGRAPFSGDEYESVVSKILAHTDEVARPIGLLRSGTPREVVKLVEQMMEKSPDDRPQSCLEVADRIKRYTQPIEPAKLFNNAHFTVQPKLTTRSSGGSNPISIAMMWIIRTCFIITGLLRRVEINPNSRFNTKPVYRYRVNFSAIFTWAIFIGVAYFIYSNIEIIEVVP